MVFAGNESNKDKYTPETFQARFSSRALAEAHEERIKVRFAWSATIDADQEIPRFINNN